jgi:chemotaxis protein MotB
MLPFSSLRLSVIAALAPALLFTACTTTRELKDNNNMLQQRVFQFQQDYNALEIAYNQTVAERDQLAGRNQELTTEVTVLKDRITSLQNILSANQIQQADELKKDIEARVKRETELKLQLDDALGKLESAANEKTLVESQMRERDAEIALQNATLDDLELRLDTLGKNSELLLTERDAARSERDDFRRQLTSLTSSKDEVTQELAKLSEQLRDREKEITTLKRDLDLSKAEASSAIANARTTSQNRELLMKTLQEKLAPAIAAKQLQLLQVEGNPTVRLTSDGLFQSGTVLLTSDGRERIRLIGDALIGLPYTEILVEGHTDSDPVKNMPFVDNWDLAAARASSVTRALSVRNDVQSGKLRAVSRAFFAPVGANDSSEGKRQNRRVDVIIVP